MYAIAEHLPVEFHLSQSEIEKHIQTWEANANGQEREKQYPHLNAPTVELKNRFKNIIAANLNLIIQQPATRNYWAVMKNQTGSNNNSLG